MSENKAFEELKKNYLILQKKFNFVAVAFKKSRIAFKRLLRNYLILKKKYLFLQKHSSKKVTELLDQINEEKYQIIFDHNRKLINVSQKFLDEIEMEKNEFGQSFYVDILFEKYLPQIRGGASQIEVKEFQFPIMIKNYMLEEEEHIHPYLYFKINGKVQYDQKNRLYLYLLSAQNISANVELNYFQKTDTLITELSFTNYTLMKAKKTIEMHKIMLISLICSLVEEYNRETSKHLQKIRTLTSYLSEESKRMGLIEVDNYDLDEYVKDINYTSVLHDIGKMGIPNQILAKDIKLNDEELKIMRTHTKIGAEYIQKIMDIFKEDESYSLYINFLKIPYEICLYHHERWDGKGYPYGLKGDEIPISARIVSVADTYDAIRANRIYTHKRKTHQEAFDIITNESGKQFDPKIVEAFVNIQDQFEQIEYEYNETLNVVIY